MPVQVLCEGFYERGLAGAGGAMQEEAQLERVARDGKLALLGGELIY